MEKDGLSVIEVKSGKNHKTHASLDHACEEAPEKLNRRIVLSKYNTETAINGVIYYPLYMSMFI
jgi:hypothetical protein